MNAYPGFQLAKNDDGLPSRQALSAELLRHLMRQYSEDFYCAGWLVDLEFSLWAMSHPEAGLPDHEKVSTPAFPSLLRDLSTLANGWWAWSSNAQDTVFVPMEEWKRSVEERKRQQPLTGSQLTGFLKGESELEFEREPDREV